MDEADDAPVSDPSAASQEPAADAVDPRVIPPIDRAEMRVLARTEYRRLIHLLDDLDDAEWELPTDCDDWTVHDIVAHLLGTAEANASVRENRRQIVSGQRLARRHGLDDIDGINRLQVEGRRHLAPAELRTALSRAAPRAVRGRYRTPRPLRRFRVPSPTGGSLSFGSLVDIVYTRDQWMHRIDVARATGRALELTAEHDGRIVADVVRQWAVGHDQPFDLELTGPAGGSFRRGGVAPRFELDAVEFCRGLSGRATLPADLPAAPVAF